MRMAAQGLLGLLEPGVSQDRWDCLDLKVSAEIQGRQENRDLQEFRVKEVPLVKMAKKAQLVLQALLDQPEREESRDPLACMASRDYLDLQVHQESQENQVIRVFLEKLDQLEPLDQEASVELLVREAIQALLVCRDPRVFLEPQDLMDQREAQDQQELLVTLDHQVCRACQERGASLGHLDLKETEELWVRRVLREQQEMTAQEDFQDLWAL